ncbi:hypothetical protein [Halobaculum magnesiiphilum]|uniref:Uncharacterized protein n=1 Tax=Halobaculum magnesiiphilum TaxID=1017351 RepID=A0A8T8WF79_9EURY|nr:hypothetical protein [Halobaculum magnesiiphilum]QZP38509.1 hypothetical protein K6T50_05040 [Halobaculum magnesiiphilum]
MRRPTAVLVRPGDANAPTALVPATSDTAGTGTEYFPPRRRPLPVRLSTAVLLIGVGLFVLPFPGTFIGGGLVLVAGAGLRYLGV